MDELAFRDEREAFRCDPGLARIAKCAIDVCHTVNRDISIDVAMSVYMNSGSKFPDLRIQ